MSKPHSMSYADGLKKTILVTNEDIYQSHSFEDFNCIGDYLRWRFLYNHGVFIKDISKIKKMVNTVHYCLEFIGKVGEGLSETRPWGKDDKSFVQGIGAPELEKAHPLNIHMKAGGVNGKKAGNEVQRENPEDLQKSSDQDK